MRPRVAGRRFSSLYAGITTESDCIMLLAGRHGIADGARKGHCNPLQLTPLDAYEDHAYGGPDAARAAGHPGPEGALDAGVAGPVSPGFAAESASFPAITEISFTTYEQEPAIRAFYAGLLRSHGYRVRMTDLLPRMQRKPWVEGSYYAEGIAGGRIAIRIELTAQGDIMQVDLRMTGHF